MKYILGRKLEMTQRYRPNGDVVPVTIVKVEPCVITQVKTVESDGYVSVQLGCGSSKRLTKPELGQRGANGPLAVLREFRLEKADGASVGAKISVSSFAPGDAIHVTGVSKGKGFQGVVKRHHFAGGPASHGHKDNLRMPGSIGAGGHQHVHLGQRMGGRMGGDQVTVRNLEVVEVLAETNCLAVKGAVPGARNAELWIMGPGEMKFETSAASPSAEASGDESEEKAPADSAAETVTA
jgi:large subunit ribosomal protein L3